ncbi:MAG: hypothetical protein I3273_01360 [Candidatus Moeniiplasma glomeromycotorum]|nr:hypothetical protein [Candidatus Moeniiplasma glomeromycotorum]MCE8167230.1 hypothetical protein [Candidatus Moeniiplasma glomeromycotorum]MCE8168757.1 hypothetical protein [Candidatus Moeniiplasma glomeromycotorum]
MSKLKNTNTELIETKTLKEKEREIKKLKSELKKKDNELTITKQGKWFFAKEHAKLKEKLEGKLNGGKGKKSIRS